MDNRKKPSPEFYELKEEEEKTDIWKKIRTDTLERSSSQKKSSSLPHSTRTSMFIAFSKKAPPSEPSNEADSFLKPGKR